MAFAQPRLIRLAEAVLCAGSAVLGAALIARKWGPEPGHRETAAWYTGLRKPPFTPPGPAIGAVWAGLDVLLGVAGARLLAARPSPARSGALGCWAVAVAGIPGWMRTFFGGRNISGGLGVIAGMLAATLAGIRFSSDVDRPAAAALVPLAGWLGFAGVLNGEIWRRNG